MGCKGFEKLQTNQRPTMIQMWRSGTSVHTVAGGVTGINFNVSAWCPVTHTKPYLLNLLRIGCFGGEFSTIRTCTGETTCTSLGDRVGCRAMWEDMKDLSQQAEDVPSSSTSQWYQTDPTSTLVSTSTATRKPDDAPIAWKELSAGPTSQSTLEWKEMTTLPTSTQTSTTSQPVSTLLPTSQDTKPPTTTLDTTESAFPPAATVSTSSAQSPHYVVYSDAWLHNMPSAAELAGYNKFVLAFWLSSSGAADNAKLWQDLGSSEQRRIVQEYTKAGITLMVSAFGATDTPVSAGKDPIDTARQLADWVKRNNLQGVDIDLEDLGGMEQGKLVDWVISKSPSLTLFARGTFEQILQNRISNRAPKAASATHCHLPCPISTMV